MNVRDDELEQQLSKLPKHQPRPGLKHEIFHNIMNEVRHETAPMRTPKRKFLLSALGAAVTTIGACVAVVTMIYLLPEDVHPTKRDAHLVSGSGAVSFNEQKREEVAYRKAERENQILQQLVPRPDGTVVGEGVEIVLTDMSATMIRKGMLSDDVQTSFDLYRIVQELYENGGALVSINGIMVEPFTKIVTRGALTEVHNRRINSPFTIKVIGDADTLYKGLKQQKSVLSQMQADDTMNYAITRNDAISIALK